MDKIINTKILQRIDTSANWEAHSDVVLANGELGLERTTDDKIKIKVGDGTSAWAELDYVKTGSSSGTAGAYTGENGIEITDEDVIRTTFGDETDNSVKTIYNGLIDINTEEIDDNVYVYAAEVDTDVAYNQLKEMIHLEINEENLGSQETSIYYYEDIRELEIELQDFENSFAELPPNVVINLPEYLYGCNAGGSYNHYIPINQPIHITFDADSEAETNITFEPIIFTSQQIANISNIISDYDVEGITANYLINHVYAHNMANAYEWLLEYLKLRGLFTSENIDMSTEYHFDLTFTPETGHEQEPSYLLMDMERFYHSSDHTNYQIYCNALSKNYLGDDSPTNTILATTAYDIIPYVAYNINNATDLVEQYGHMAFYFISPYEKLESLKPSIFIIFASEDGFMFVSDTSFSNPKVKLYTYGTGYETLPENTLRGSEYIKINDGEIKLRLGEYNFNKKHLFHTQIIPAQETPGPNVDLSETTLLAEINTDCRINPRDESKCHISYINLSNLNGDEQDLIWESAINPLYIEGVSDTEHIYMACYNCTTSSVLSWLNSYIAQMMATTNDFPILQKEDPDKIAFCIVNLGDDDECKIITSQDFTDLNKYELDVYKYEYSQVKLPSEYVDINIQPTTSIHQGSTQIPTAGTVYDALSNIQNYNSNLVFSVNNITPTNGNIDLDISGAYWFGYYNDTIYDRFGYSGLTVSDYIGDSSGEHKIAEPGAILMDAARKVYIYDELNGWKQFASALEVTTDFSSNTVYQVPKAYSVYQALKGADAVDTYQLARFKGTTFTQITDGGSETPSGITKVKGDIIFYNNTPFIWTGSTWKQLGGNPTIISSSTGISNSSTDSELASAKAIYKLFQDFINDVIGGEY